MAPTDMRATVGEIWPVALPAGTVLAGGQRGLSGAIEWVITLRASYPLFGELGEGYLALASLSLARNLDAQITGEYLITELHRAGAAGLVIDEPISAAGSTLADELALPVFILPEGSTIHQVERDILRALVDREGQLARREVEARRRLKQVFSRGGIEALLNDLAVLTTADAMALDGGGVVVSRAEVPLSAQRTVETAFPIEVAGRVLGRLLLYLHPGQSDLLPTIYARQAAEICGIEMLQQHTRQETEERLGLDLIEQLLDEGSDDTLIVSRLARLGYRVDDDRRHVVVAIGAIGDAERQNRHGACHDLACELQRAAQRDDADVIAVGYRGKTLVFCAMAPATAERRVRDWLYAVLTHCDEESCCVGVSRVVCGIGGLRAAAHQALDARELGRHIGGLESPYFYEQMGLYRLLAELRGCDELRRFYEETLGALVLYDREHNTDLVHTLKVFFDENANVSQTARALYVHRNTLNYRLQRIIEIIGLDLNDAEARLTLQLALKIHGLFES
ncbi:MAG: helix-turn-helix domain-containing protein [Anaerolineae bacterium]|jgi:purine catabolism regulator